MTDDISTTFGLLEQLATLLVEPRPPLVVCLPIINVVRSETGTATSDVFVAQGDADVDYSQVPILRASFVRPVSVAGVGRPLLLPIAHSGMCEELFGQVGFITGACMIASASVGSFAVARAPREPREPWQDDDDEADEAPTIVKMPTLPKMPPALRPGDILRMRVPPPLVTPGAIIGLTEELPALREGLRALEPLVLEIEDRARAAGGHGSEEERAFVRAVKASTDRVDRSISYLRSMSGRVPS